MKSLIKLMRFFNSGPASVIVGNLVQGNRLASAAGRDIGGLEEETSECGGRRYNYISEILRWRNHATPDHVLFTLLNSKGAVAQSLTCSQLHKKAERIACLLIEKVGYIYRCTHNLSGLFSASISAK